MVHFGTYETPNGRAERSNVRMICYTADYQGSLSRCREIVEKA